MLTTCKNLFSLTNEVISYSKIKENKAQKTLVQPVGVLRTIEYNESEYNVTEK